VASITEECIKYFESVHPTETTQSQSAEDGALSDPPPAKRLRGLAAVLKQIQDNDGSTLSSSTPTPRQQIDKEINSYLDFPAVESDTDPLTWWKMENG